MTRPMDPLYVLQPPAGPAVPPTRWSYSALREWRECPRRWALRHSQYPNVSATVYPERYGRAALEGRLVHDAMEEFLGLRRARKGHQFNLYEFLQVRLRGILDADSRTNPRIDPAGLWATVSLDDCAARFLSILERMALPPLPVSGPVIRRERSHAVEREPPPGPPAEAEEFEIRLDAPALQGRIDQVKHGRLIDYKTGEPDERHLEQLRFYAVLWWLKYREVPSGLALIYAERPDPVELTVPSQRELEQSVVELRDEIDDAVTLLAEQTEAPRPHAEVCRFCPVRQLCGAYWTADATRSLRVVSEAGGFADLRITQPPPTWAPGRAMAGTAVVELGGEGHRVNLLVDRLRCPERHPESGLILGARVDPDESGWKVRAVVTSEVFWELPLAPAD